MKRTDRSWHVMPVTEKVALWCRVVAWTWGGLAVAVLWLLALNDIIPESPGGKSLGGYGEALQLGALAVYATGLLVSWPVPSLGAATMAVGALLLGLLAGVQYESWFTVLLALVLIVPPVLVWLAWQRHQRLRGLTALATVTLLLLATVWFGAAEVKARNFGPAHPQSVLRPLPASALDWVWSGAVTPTSFSVVARVRLEARTAVLVVGTGLVTESSAIRSAPAEVGPDADGIVRLSIDGLVPETEYHYAVEVDGTLDTTRSGRVRTLPDGPASFALAFASCARTGSNGSIFDEIARRDPLVYVEIGDFYYGDVTSDDQGQMIARLSQSLRAPAQA
ncbi:MAG TPA: hypothetical protein VF855_11430, partial [Acidimicrobiales bacterium]